MTHQIEDEIRRILSDENEEFRNWVDEHREHEQRLATLAGKSSLTIDEEIEEKHLKKRKLFLKDQMAEKMRQYESAHSAHI